MEELQEEKRVFGFRDKPRTLWLIGTQKVKIERRTHLQRTIMNSDESALYVDVTSQFPNVREFYEDFKKNKNFVIKLGLRVSVVKKVLSNIDTKTRFFLFHRKFVNEMTEEELPRVVTVNNRAVKKAFVFCEVFADSLQFVHDPNDEVWNEEMRFLTSFEEVRIIKLEEKQQEIWES